MKTLPTYIPNFSKGGGARAGRPSLRLLLYDTCQSCIASSYNEDSHYNHIATCNKKPATIADAIKGWDPETPRSHS